MSRPTRKSIGDANGNRSVYVVEVCQGGIWIPYWSGDGNGCGFSQQPNASDARNNIYQHCKNACSKWTRKNFRVFLYVRAEEK